MATGEFEYVKPPHFYIDQASKEDPGIPTFGRKRREVIDPNPLINGVRPESNENEVEINIDDENTSTKKIVVKTKKRKPIPGRTPKLKGLEEEIAEKYSSGMGLSELAKLYGVSMPCISKTVRRAGGEIRGRGQPKGKPK